MVPEKKTVHFPKTPLPQKSHDQRVINPYCPKNGTAANAMYQRKDQRNDAPVTVREEGKDVDMTAPQQQKRGREKESNTGTTTNDNAANRRYHKERRTDEGLEELQEVTMMSLNIRGFNGEEKQQVIGDLIHRENFHLVCLNETKLTIPVYLDNYWSHQTMLQRNGGTWTAATNKVRLSLVKALGTYFCWTKMTTGKNEVQILNCYLEPGE